VVQTELAEKKKKRKKEKKKKRKKEKKKKRKLFLRKSFAKKNGDFLTNYGAADGCANIVLVCMVRMDYAYHNERVTYIQTENLTSCLLQLWYSQQVAEGNAPGHPLGFDRSQRFGPIKMLGGKVRVTKTTMLQPMVLMVIVRPASTDSVVSFVIADSNQIGFCFHMVGFNAVYSKNNPIDKSLANFTQTSRKLHTNFMQTSHKV
jgi:hypothetical protein